MDWVGKGQAVVLIPERLTPPAETVRWALEACEEAASMGVKTLVDPVMARPGSPRPPADTIASARLAALEGLG